MRTMRLALSFVALATQGVLGKEIAILSCSTQTLVIIDQNITEQGVFVRTCGGQSPTACISSDDCQVGFCTGGTADCAGSLKVLFKHGYKLAFITPQPVGVASTNGGSTELFGHIIYTLEK